jgi:hypothetical protein
MSSGIYKNTAILWVNITEIARTTFHIAITLHNLVLFIKLYMYLKKLVTWALILISTGVEIRYLFNKMLA